MIDRDSNKQEKAVTGSSSRPTKGIENVARHEACMENLPRELANGMTAIGKGTRGRWIDGDGKEK